MTSEREFDIVVWGASGAVGRRVAHHMASRAAASGNVRWALGGRDLAALERVKADIGPAAADAPIVIGDNHDVASLEAMVARTRVVCTTVGPFALHGSELLGACVRAGVDYCDLTAEPHWMRKMMDAHETEAGTTGARIVHSCGHDSISSDLGVFFLQRAAMEKHGEPCRHIKLFIERMKGGFSGGTAASFLHAMEEGPNDPSMGRFMREPYCLNPAGLREGPDPPDKMMPAEIRYDEDLRAWTRPYFMAPMNAKNVRRTNALLGYPYGKDFRYDEAKSDGPGVSGWWKALKGAIGSTGFLMAMAIPPTRRLLKRHVLPKSGEGPSREVRESGFYDLILIGKLRDGTVMRARVTGKGDPGVESTSRMLVEAALCLARDEIAVSGGFWTPAAAFGELLLPRLTDHAELRFDLV